MNTKNLKPFNLQAALQGEPVMLRDGSKAFVRHYESEQKVNDGFRLWGVVAHEWSTCTVTTWSTQGRFYGGLGDSSLDIIGMWPKTRIINGFEVPAPESEELEMGDMYFTISIGFEDFHDVWEWGYTKLHKRYLERGLVFLRKEDAIANAKAMLGIDPHNEEAKNEYS